MPAYLSKLPRGQKVVCPLLDIIDGNIKSAERVHHSFTHVNEFQ